MIFLLKLTYYFFRGDIYYLNIFYHTQFYLRFFVISHTRILNTQLTSISIFLIWLLFPLVAFLFLNYFFHSIQQILSRSFLLQLMIYISYSILYNFHPKSRSLSFSRLIFYSKYPNPVCLIH